MWGDEYYQDGKRYFKSLISDAKDSQAMFNFWRSATTELVALAPKTPWVGPKGFIPKGHESKWASANTRSHAYLEFDPASGGAPQRQAFAGVPAGAMQEALSSNEDMQAITGIYPSSIGARSNETSGRAIMARERQGRMSQTSISSTTSPEPSNTQAKSSLTLSHQSILSVKRSGFLVKTKLRKSYNLRKRLEAQIEEGMTGDKKTL